MTDNCKPKFTFNDKLPPMTKKIEVTDKVTEKKEPMVEKATKEKKRKKKKNPKRCQMEGCRKKLPITAYDCRCEKRFCNLHSSSESHNCTFDYKTFHRNNLVDKAGLGGGIADKIIDRV